jgi:UDP-N-acetyl-2-amino-2-deoxyglucuronate dehydrogenase
MSLRVGIVGTGAIANLHARAYANIGFVVRACTDIDQAAAARFAAATGAERLDSIEAIAAHPEVDFVDVCTLPDVRVEPVTLAARHGKHVQVQKPIAANLAAAREMVAVARDAGIVLGVVSQHRFVAASQFLIKAIADGRLGRLLQCDAYVKWYRSDAYYARPIKGTWKTEGGGALISQAIHQVDLLRWFAGPIRDVVATWQLGSIHRIESEDIVNALVRYESGATGVIQAATAFWPGYPERVEVHGTKGSAIITGDRLTTWDLEDDAGDPPPLAQAVASGASDPMAISLEPFERQFRDFADAIRLKRKPLVAGEEGLAALELVEAIYRSARTEARVSMEKHG